MSPAAHAVSGGAAARDGEVPWQVAVFGAAGDDGISCGGSLIDATTVITAAHCVHGLDEREVRVGFGDVSADRLDSTTVLWITVHADYRPDVLTDDIAILRLRSPATGRSASIALAAPGSAPALGTRVFASGWGRTSEGGPRSAKLKVVALTVTDRRSCTASTSSAAGTLCAGASGDGVCRGDSGGPLYRYVDGRPVLVGMTAFGRTCGDDKPDGFTDIGAYADWIQAHR
ncbi:serine protease [Kitasatospora phosalacinea]|uniref:serine protease n=1 Tax=Kitasatospora phosalacinea TaxID=2065 RepID=UPI0036478186